MTARALPWLAVGLFFAAVAGVYGWAAYRTATDATSNVPVGFIVVSMMAAVPAVLFIRWAWVTRRLR